MIAKKSLHKVTNLLENRIDDFKFRYKNIHRKFKCITIESKYVNKNSFYPSIMKQIKINDKNFKWANIEHDFKLKYDKYKNKYYIHVPIYVEKKESNRKHPLAVMDSGCRTFETLYGMDHVIEIGKNMKKIIMYKISKIENLKSKIDSSKEKLKKEKKKRNRNYNRAIEKHNKKIKNIVNELHCKTCLYLCRNYERIMVSDFSSRKVNSKKKKLDKGSKKVLGKLSHYRFNQRLKNKCDEYGCYFMQVDESYTSKVCCNCGYYKKDLQSEKIFKCDKCKKIIDRDIKAAINIFIKNRDLVLK